MRIYTASSWKNQHAVEMLTALLRERGHTVLSFVENNRGENPNASANERAYNKPVPFDEWCASPDGLRSFEYDTRGATESDLVIYIAPSGQDAWAEVGAAWARGREILGLWAKGEQAGLMRRMVNWFENYKDLLQCVDEVANKVHTLNDFSKNNKQHTFQSLFEDGSGLCKICQLPRSSVVHASVTEPTIIPHYFSGNNSESCNDCGLSLQNPLHLRRDNLCEPALNALRELGHDLGHDV